MSQEVLTSNYYYLELLLCIMRNENGSKISIHTFFFAYIHTILHLFIICLYFCSFYPLTLKAVSRK